jgi:uncharacterized protein
MAEGTVMLYMLILEDDDRFADARATHMAAHLDFLERNARAVRAAGPLIDAETGKGAGGLWLVEADGIDQVTALYQADPFRPTGLRKSVRILEWRQTFAEGKRLRPNR